MSGAVWWAIPFGLILASAITSKTGKSTGIVGSMVKGPRGEMAIVVWPAQGKKKRRKR